MQYKRQEKWDCGQFVSRILLIGGVFSYKAYWQGDWRFKYCTQRKDNPTRRKKRKLQQYSL